MFDIERIKELLLMIIIYTISIIMTCVIVNILYE